MKTLLYSFICIVIISSCNPGQTVQNDEFFAYNDSLTGYEVWRITNHDSASVAGYFERQLFTTDDRYAVIASKRTGTWELFRFDLQSKELIQLSESASVHPFSYTMHPDGMHVCYMNGRALIRQHVGSFEVDTLMNYDEVFDVIPWFGGTFSHDGRYTVITKWDENGGHVYRIDLWDHLLEKAFTWDGPGFSHPLICPTNPDLITFVPYPDTQNDMTRPMEERARTWIADMNTGELRRFLTMPYGYRATHETWSWDGEKFFYYRKTQPGWIPTTIESLSLDGLVTTEYYTNDTIRLGHGISSQDGKWFISDGQDPDWNPLILIELQTGKNKIICWSDASIDKGHENFSHVHPSFSHSGNYVIYTSDVTGVAQAYIVPIKGIIENWHQK